MSWFDSGALGLIFHWGVYSAAARGEWVMNRERLTPEGYYRRYGEKFTGAAEHWNPDEWMEDARRSGATYVILTTRHHDGFCLWPTETTPWHCGAWGFSGDFVGSFVAAARRHSLAVGLYYSLADWSHPAYPSPWERDWPLAWPPQCDCRAFVDYCRRQLHELLTRYGPIDYLWYDGAFPQPLDGEETNRMVLDLQPDILINERNGAPCHVAISEQSLHPKEGRWESAITLNRNWGYHATDHRWKTCADVVRSLLEVRSTRGNLLLNVGPRADGTIPEPSRAILQKLGEWLSCDGAQLSGARTPSPFSWNNSVMLLPGQDAAAKQSELPTALLYITEELHADFRLWEFTNTVTRIHCPRENRDLQWRQDADGALYLTNPPAPREGLPVCLELYLQGPLNPVTTKGQHWIL